ncbi:facilitated trehalose transporter Tret1-like [Chrysoperla carnea]|uniref:facilitated trehalose transporter Tret1-like n=1 Tax=Chrysoperla carnea TaxID=189513 RepID=UPI001D075CE0|nr:facilitated trehalose transporter Tret1-like [Chrysoperla carnea]
MKDSLSIIKSESYLSRVSISLSTKDKIQQKRNTFCRYLPQCLAVLSASLAFFSRGLHQGWTSPALPKLLTNGTETNSYFQITTEEGSWIVTLYSGSISIGAPVAAFLIFTVGRKTTILFSAVPHLMSLLLIAFAGSVEYLYVARVLAGFSEGVANIAVPAYVGEIADSNIRGVLSCVYTVLSISGLLLINIIGSYTTIFQTSMICSVFPILLILTFFWMPESPYFHLMQNNSKSAEKCLQQLRGTKNVKTELVEITHAVEKQMLNAGTFTDLFTIRSNRRALQLAIALETIQQLSGITAILSYAQIIFIESGQKMSSEMSSIILMSVQLVMSMIGASVVDRLGRRPLLMFSCFGCFLALFFEGLYFYFQYIEYQYIDNLFWLPLVALISYFIVYSAGLAIILNVYAGEIFSTSVKGKALGLVMIWYGILAFFASKLFQKLVDDIGMFVPFWMYAFSCLLGLIYAYLWVPETKGKTLEEIQDWLENN